MTGLYFRVQKRFKDFGSEINHIQFNYTRLLIFTAGWLFTFYVLIYVLDLDLNWHVFWALGLGYFWYQLNKIFLQRLPIPAEILLLVILFFFLIDHALINLIFGGTEASGIVGPGFWSFPGQFHLLFSAIQIFAWGLLLVQSSSKKQAVLLIYVIFAVVGHQVGFFEGQYYLFIFQALLFFSLLKRTDWLQELTRLELALYFIISFGAFWSIKDISPIIQINSGEAHAVLWHSMPLFLFLLVKLYFLALLIKIPVTIVYNHAGLSRKLWISGLFQSTFPQLIQMIIILYIFYLFICGWQAQKLNEALSEAVSHQNGSFLLENIENGSSQSGHFRIPGYRPVPQRYFKTPTGIVILEHKSNERASNNSADYLIFTKSGNDIAARFIDFSFMNELAENTPVIAGSGVIGYNYRPNRWQGFIEKIRFWQKDKTLQKSPFMLLNPFLPQSAGAGRAVLSLFDKTQKTQNGLNIRFGPYYLHESNLRFGRLIIPVVNPQNDKDRFSLDIYYNLGSLLKWNYLTKILLLLIGLYAVFNIFITRRVVEFGSQINRSIIQKFDQLKIAIREISSGNLNYKVNLEGEDEFVELGERFNQMGENLQEKVNELREKDRLDQELKIAREVQLSLLPEKLPKINGYEISAELKTATEVGGDFYDVIQLGKDKFLIAVGDVSGKGSSAAFYMAQFISLIRHTIQFVDHPKEIARHLNEYVMKRISDRQLFITAVIGVLDSRKNTFEFVRAGHMPVLLLPSHISDELKEYNTNGLGIGLTASEDKFTKSLEVGKIVIKEDDTILLYTDGITEAARPLPDKDGKETFEHYGDDHFVKLLNQLRGAGAGLILRTLLDDLESFYGDNQQLDDHTILIFKKLTT